MKAHPAARCKRTGSGLDVDDAAFVRADLAREDGNSRSNSVAGCHVASGEFEIVDAAWFESAKPKRVAGKCWQRRLDIIKLSVLSWEQSRDACLSGHRAACSCDGVGLKQFGAETACLPAIVDLK